MPLLFLEDMNEKLIDLQKILGVSFSNLDLLTQALTHSSYSKEKNNERICFLGDAILGMIASDYLFHKFPDYSEGELTKLKSKLVNRRSLSIFAKKIGIPKFLLLSKQEMATGGMKKPSILSEALEALIGAIFIDCGMEAVRNFIINYLTSYQEAVVCDYKSTLQELCQKNFKTLPEYRLIEQIGKDHKPVFNIEVSVCGIRADAKGKSKKEAEQNAAKKLLKKIAEGKCQS